MVRFDFAMCKVHFIIMYRFCIREYHISTCKYISIEFVCCTKWFQLSVNVWGAQCMHANAHIPSPVRKEPFWVAALLCWYIWNTLISLNYKLQHESEYMSAVCIILNNILQICVLLRCVQMHCFCSMNYFVASQLTGRIKIWRYLHKASVNSIEKPWLTNTLWCHFVLKSVK